MPKIGDHKEPADIACERCGGKRKVSKTWTEKIKNDHGVMVLHHTQIICTNKDCQAAFDKNLKEENIKREKLKQTRIDNATKRLTAKEVPTPTA